MAQSKTTNSKTKSGGRDSAKKAPAKSARASKTKEEKAREKAEEQLLAAQLQENLRRKKQIKDNIAAVAFISVGVFFIVSLYTNSTGSVGAALQGVLNGLFGRAVSLVIGVFLALFGILIFARKTAFLTLRTWLSIAALFISAACLSASREADALLAMTDVRFREFYATGVDSGGLVGNSLCLLLLRAVGKTGLYLICAVLILVSVMFILNTPISAFFDDILLKAEARRRAREEKAAAEAEGRQLTIDVPKNVPIVPEVIAPDDEPVFASSLSELEPVGEQKAPEEELPVFKLPKDEPARLSRSEARAETRGTAASGMLNDEGDPMPPFDLFDSDRDGITDNQKNILMMVRSDSLFDEKPKPRSNFGLNGDSLIQTERPSIAAPEKTGPEPGSFEDIFGVTGPVGKGASAKSSSGKGLGDEGASPAPQAEAADQAAAGGSGSAKAASASASGASETSVKKPAEPSYKFPPITLLGKNSSVVGGANGNLWDQAELLESTLASFGVSAKVIDVVRGPAVTRFEVQPATGVKVQRIVALQDDLALNLRAKSLRIEAPIPGKAAVGVEISNEKINTVYLREILEAKEFKTAKSKISVGLGRSVAGEPVVANLKDMPHLLIAGATGSGKSVCINSILISLLYKATPKEVNMILIDPKVVELSVYNGIPHLIGNVVTDPAKASQVLNWAVAEMDKRYDKFASESVRDLQSYNETVRMNGEEEKVMPQMIIVIDELADLMMTAKKQVETSIARIAQKARAAGMYLIIATQRPSTDIITGVIKANIPSRIAFAVANHVDSGTILDMSGAEKLLGKGDMLYYPQGVSKPLRVQGCYVSDEEVKSVIEYVKGSGKPSESTGYEAEISSVLASTGQPTAENAGSDGDELLEEAIEAVIKARQASVSSLQRRFRIGYNRSARLIDLMEEMGVVGPADGARPRKVLWDQAMLENYINGPDDEVPEEI